MQDSYLKLYSIKNNRVYTSHKAYKFYYFYGTKKYCMSENPLKEMFKPSRIYPLAIIGLMFAWWQFYLKPLKTEKIKMYTSSEGYFKTKDKEDIFSASFSAYKHTVKGVTMGVISYTIHYFDEEERNLKPQIDSVLTLFNNTFSTYVPSSAISNFNNGLFIYLTLIILFRASVMLSSI